MSDATVPPLRILVLAPLRHPIRAPFAGGLEASLWHDVAGLRRRGHHVTSIAVEGSDLGGDPDPVFVLPRAQWSGPPLDDTSYPPGYLDRAFEALDHALLVADRDGFDVIANHCLHGLPVRRSGMLRVPMLTTLHTPVLPELVAAHHGGGASSFIAVSDYTARDWATAGIPSVVVPNGIDEAEWPLGDGGGPLLWFGRIVPEKAPHLAIQVARHLGRQLVLIGRVGDEPYHRERILPELDDSIRWLGPLAGAELARAVGGASCVLVTPEWDEPFGLVAVEALLTGTPVAAFAVGGLTEIALDMPGMLTRERGDVLGLAAAVEQLTAAGTQRVAVREAARRRFSLESRLDALEALYASAAASLDTEACA